MRAVSTLLTHAFRHADAGPMSMASIVARRRFRNSMPGELGACAAARLFGLGR